MVMTCEGIKGLRKASKKIQFNTAVCVPLYNGGRRWRESVDVLRGVCSNHIRCLAVDSGSADGTAQQATESGFEVITIAQSEFNHGATRNMMFERVRDEVDIIIFATQDAIIESVDTVTVLVEAFTDPEVGVAFARQLPHVDAGHIGSHARLFNYPAVSRAVSKEDIPALGIKTAFISNSFAAYRVRALQQVNGFPNDVILGEDMCAAAKMILSGWKVAYSAESRVYHSHDYTSLQEFRRYFDIGVLHARQSWLLEKFGNPEGEGGRFVRSEIKYLYHNAPHLIPIAMMRTILKYAGYRLGRLEHMIPLSVKSKMSMHQSFWL